MSRKRSAATDIDRDTLAEVPKADSTEPIAPETAAAPRVFLKAKRKGETAAASSTPATASSSAAASSVPLNPWAKFAPPPGSWECPACEVNNKKEAEKCKACETPNPNLKAANTEADKPKDAPSNTFGGFTFGAPAAAESANAANTNPTGGFSFAWPTGGFSFGGGSGFSVDSNGSSSGGFTFGSSTFGDAAPASFGAVAGEGFGAAAEDGAEEDPSSFVPTSSLGHASASHLFKDRPKESSGEEADTTHHRLQTKAFILKSETKEDEAGEAAAAPAPKWVELGVGELHLNTYQSNSKTKGRFILRADKTQRLLLNSPIFKGIIYNIQNERVVRFHSFDLEGQKASYLIKFKTKAEAEECVEGIKSIIETLN